MSKELSGLKVIDEEEADNVKKFENKQIKCPKCDKNYKGYHGLSTHYSLKHDQKLGERKVRTNCKMCNEPLLKNLSDFKKGDSNYCDNECQKLYEIENNLLCGREPVDKVYVNCDYCDKELEKYNYRVNDNNFCNNKCKGRYFESKYTGINNPNWSGGHEKYYGKNWQEARLKVLKRDNYNCQDCGITNDFHKELINQELHIHHKKEIKKFSNKEVANKKSNLITLCCECHRERHNNND